MKKINLLWICAFIILLPVAIANCAPSTCPTGATDAGISCNATHCTRTCTGTICGTSWTQDYSNDCDIYSTSSSADEEYCLSSTYTASNTNKCYRYDYDSSSSGEVQMTVQTSVNPDCDSEAIAGFADTTSSTKPWFENLTNYIGYVSSDEPYMNYILKTMRAHAEVGDDATYRSNAKTTYSAYCTPTAYACNNVSTYLSDCDTGCYNHATRVQVVQGYELDKGTPDQTLYYNGRCGSGTVSVNKLRNNFLKVYSTSTTTKNDLEICEIYNPSVFDVKVININANAGDYLECNYTYWDPHNYAEHNSSYEWYKNAANQNINSKIVAKGNLTPGDVWYCKVEPYNGLELGSKIQSSNNVTIASALQNPKFYVEDNLTWNNNGYFSDEETITSFNDELQGALMNCVADAQGYCNISLKFSSDAVGKLDISKMEIYYELQIRSLSIYSITEYFTNNSIKIIEFKIENNGTEIINNFTWYLNMGDGNSYLNQTINLNISEIKTFNITHTYNNPGPYNVTVLANDGINPNITSILSINVNHPPNITSNPVTTAAIGTQYTYNVAATDKDNDALTYSLTTAPSGMSINSSTGTIKWTSVSGQQGNNAVIVRVDDAESFDNQSFVISVSNRNPIITSTPITIASVGTQYSYTVTATDGDNDALTYSLTTSPNGMSINSSTGAIKWTPVSGQQGNNSIIATVSDNYGGAVNQSFVITVANSIPTITSTPTTIASVGTQYSYTVTANDADNDALTYTLTVGPTGMSVGATSGTITWTPVSGDQGNNPVIVTASDNYGGAINQSFTITVANSVPAITSTPTTTASIGTQYSYTVTANDADNDALTYTLTAGPTGMSVGATSGTITWTPTSGDQGNHPIIVTASDNYGGAVNQSFTITVANSVPAITSTPTTTASIGTQYSYTVTANDADNDALTYTLTAGPTGMSVGATSGTITWTPASGDQGNHPIIVTASDNYGGAINQSFTITVQNINPTIVTSPITTVVYNNAYSYDVNATDADNDTLTYSLVTSPTGMTINSVTGLIGWLPAIPWTYFINVSAADPFGGYSHQFFSIIVTDPANKKPTITSTPNTNAIVNTQYSYTAVGNDADGDTLTYSLIISPSGMTINSATGAITWTPSTPGNYKVGIWVSDYKGGYGSQNYTITVTTAGTIACYQNSECGTGSYNGGNYCSAGNVYQNYDTPTCNNPGTTSASCTTVSNPVLTQTCSYGCSAGICTTATCSDSDNNLDYYTQGTATKGTETKQDSCFDRSTNSTATSCSGSNCTLIEYSCNLNDIYQTNYVCDCSNGACTTSSALTIDSYSPTVLTPLVNEGSQLLPEQEVAVELVDLSKHESCLVSVPLVAVPCV
ncbi:putative Ig domain-containing protein [Nanoarchaeota archaeon]